MTEIIWDAPSKRGGEFDRGQPLNERQGGGLFGELAYFQTISYFNKCFFGELAYFQTNTY